MSKINSPKSRVVDLRSSGFKITVNKKPAAGVSRFSRPQAKKASSAKGRRQGSGLLAFLIVLLVLLVVAALAGFFIFGQRSVSRSMKLSMISPNSLDSGEELTLEINYENLDNLQMRVHDYFKFLKFGYDRATDWACLHIRRGRLTRKEALALVERRGGKFPLSYLGCPLEEILRDIGMTLEEFIRICDRFTNKKLFLCDAEGNLVKDQDGNLTKINYDNSA